MQLPKWSVYGSYRGNYGAHALVFTDAQDNRFWFSYRTLVAFDIPGGKVVHQNDWGPTTGKHLNAIDGGDKKARVSDAVFKAKFQAVYGAMNRAA
jgi:hypothetical protein